MNWIELRMINTFLKHLYEFAARNEISKSEAKKLIYSGQPMRIYSTKLNGKNIVRDIHSVNGPSGNALYNYDDMGYLVVYDEDSYGFRTFVLEKVTKLNVNGKVYLVI